MAMDSEGVHKQACLSGFGNGQVLFAGTGFFDCREFFPSNSFRRLQELTRGGMRPSMNGSRPIDDLMQGVLDGAAVQTLLLPLRGGGGGSDFDAEGEHGQPGEGKSRRAKKNAKKNVKRKAAKKAAKRRSAKRKTEGQLDKEGKDEKNGGKNRDAPRRRPTAGAFPSRSTCPADVRIRSPGFRNVTRDD
jgi:hypothetical protein